MQGSTNEMDYGDFFRNLPTPHILIRADDNLTIVDQNDAHAKIALNKRSDVIGRPMLEAFPDNSEEYAKTGFSELAESFRRVIRTGKPDAMPLVKYDLRDKNGQVVERWWRAKHYPLFKSDGSVDVIYQVTEDVSDEIKARQTADRIQSQLDSALKIGLVSTWTWDMKRDVVTGDKNLARSFGVSIKLVREGLPLQRFIASIHADDRQRVAEAIQKAVKSGGDYSQDYRTSNSKGKEQWVKARGKVEYDEDQVPVFFIGVLIDITDQKLAEQKLAQSQLQYNALFNSTIVAIAMANTRGQILEVNKTFLRLFGYSTKEFKAGMTSAQVSFHQNDTTTNNLYDTLRNYGEAEPVRKHYKRKDGSRFTGLVGAAMLPGSQETFMAFIIDVTENEQLKELNRAKDDFVALASHQLRSPATIVKQYLGVTIDEMAGPLSPDQLQFLTVANNANNRQLTIIDDLLKTAQIDTRGYNVSLQPKNIVSLVRDAIDQYESVFDSRNQNLHFKSETESLIVRADEAELTICIANLLENASKYSAGGTTIDVTIETDKHAAVLTVKDRGVGIAESNHDKVFEKFTRVDNELSDTVSGSGLGLYWVKRIVEIHGGKLSLQSKLGKGTTIVVRLPI